MEFLDKIYAEGKPDAPEEMKENTSGVDNPDKKPEPKTKISDGKQGKSDNDSLSIVMAVIEQALRLKDKAKFTDFIDGLEDTHKTYLDKVIKSKTSPQEKAIVSALLNKYPKLTESKKQELEFKSHVTNMMNINKLGDGSLKYLLERLSSKNVDEDKPKPEQPEQPEQPEGSEQPQNEEGQPEAQEAEGGAVEQQSAPGQPEDSQNSSMDFYDVWEDEFNDTDTNMSEEDFSDLIDDDFIDEALSDSNYAQIVMGSTVIEPNLLGGAVLGAVLGGVYSLSKGAITKINSIPLRNRLKELDKELDKSYTNNEQKLEVKSLLSLIKKGKLIGLVRSKLDNNKVLFNKKQLKILTEVIYIYSQLRKDEIGLGIMSLGKKVASGAWTGLVLARLASLFKGSQ